MSSSNLDVYIPIFILLAIATLMVGGAFLVSKLIAPSNPTHKKQTAYECGEEPVDGAWSLFNVRFYVVGLIFIIFDVESTLMFPVATVFKKMKSIGEGGPALIVLLLFVLVMIEGIVYCWKKGDLDWIRSYKKK